MNPLLSKIILVVVIGVSVCLVAYRPDWLGDTNSFLKDFINHNYLNILGVILAITLASLSQLHLSLGRLKTKLGEDGLADVRSEIRSSAIWLIGGFILGLVAVTLKPIIATGVTGEASINAFCLIILVFYVMVLADITLSVFDI